MKKFLFILLVVLVVSSVTFAGRGNMSSSGSRWESSQNGRGNGRFVASEEQDQYGKGQGYGYQNQDQACDEFVDEDGDGVWDNCDGEGFGHRWDRSADTEIIDPVPSQYGRNEDRAVRGRGTGSQGKGAYCDEFVDEDGDGVWDNCDGEGFGHRWDRSVDTEITDPVPSLFCRNVSGRFSGQIGRGNSRNGRK